ncbi:MAG: hypothetical protein IJ410_08930 [Oscillospiraceae bacterium]|nr:hypothetical protein [Oscillospiraceae bacterium]
MKGVTVVYNVGDIVFYSSTGICEVKHIGDPGVGLPTHVDYYTLQPLSKNHREMIYVPTDTKVFMRYAIDARQAQQYIDMVKELSPVQPESRNPKMIQDFYSNLLGTYECRNLLLVIVSLTAKKREMAARNKPLNQTQTSFLKRAQEMVYNEFAWALGKTSDEVADIIESEIVL